MGDSRRNERVIELLHGIVQGQSSRSVGSQGGGREDNWARVMGAYRFFNNDQVPRPVLQAAVLAALRQVAPAEGRLYVLHDISDLDYSQHQSKRDRTQVGNEKGLGYELYTALLVDAQGQTLGPCVYELLTADGVLSSAAQEPLPFVDHYEQVERGALAAHLALPGRELVQVADREFDDLQLERWLATKEGLFVQRAKQMERRVLHAGEHKTLGQATSTVLLTQRAQSVERDGVDYEVWRGETIVTLDGKSHRGVKQKRAKPKSGVALELRCVVSELRPRTGNGKVERWVLLTNLEDPLDQVVQIYLWRWRIERFFFLTKVGFRLENWRQENGERVARRLAVTMLAAMLIYQLQRKGDADSMQVLAQIARMGGHIPGPKRVPGAMVLMRGIGVLLAALSMLERHSAEDLRHLAEAAGLPVRSQRAVARRAKRAEKARRSAPS
jgi:hypothetical protein